MKKIVLTLALLVTLASCKKTETTTIPEPTDAVSGAVTTTQTPVSETRCFLSALKKDSTSISLTIGNDNVVTGRMHWNPNEKDGAIGTLTGKKMNDTIVADYDFMIEGNKQMEEKVFVLSGDKLYELMGQMDDKSGKMIIKDLKKAKVRSVLSIVDCATLKFPN